MTVMAPVGIGSQVPRIRSVPAYSTSAGDEAVELAAASGLVLDPWQQLVLRDALAEDDSGRWSAFEVCLVCPRQQGKGSILEAVELAGLFLFGEKLILHSAHEFKTAREAFLRVLTLVDGSDSLRKLVAPRGVRTSHGEEGIELRNGARLRFVARSTGSGRGFSGDRVILDEAYNLGSDSMAALLPTLSARPNPQLWYTSSSGMVTSEQLHAVRKRGRAGGDPSLCYLEWSSDPDDLDLDDRGAWGQANPALGIRISEDHIARERAALGDAEFARERLGVWDEILGEQVIPVPAWLRVADPLSQVTDPVMFSLDVSPDRGSASIGVAGMREDGRFHIEVVERRPGTAWVVPRLAEVTTRNACLGVTIDDRSPAAALKAELVAAEVNVVTTSTSEMAQACGQFFDAATQDGLRHLDQPVLNVALSGARKRPLGDAWAWHRQALSVDITPLVAVTLALFGFRRQLGARVKSGRAAFF